MANHPGFSAVTVEIDPRTGSASVRLAVAFAGDPAELASRIEAAATRAALAVLGRETQCPSVSVSVVVGGSAGRQGGVGFVGEMSRGEQTFSSHWLAPALRGG
jgi:hypothetical protein